MLIRRLFIMLIALLTSGTSFAADNPDLQVRASKSGAKVSVDHVIKDGKVVVTVVDAGDKPVFGLKDGDFAVTQSGRTANILSVKPISESLDVPRNFVLVLDNSYSMKERGAIDALLAGVSELLKIVRPIDQVRIVAFDNFNKVEMDGYVLSVRTFKSNQPDKLKEFAAEAYKEGITGSTVLYDALLAGLKLIGKMPAAEPRFMVVFSDGEDLNSTYNRTDVLKEAQKLKGFNAYAIDYMPSSYTDKFLSEFAGQNRGQVWKARSENNLVGIFQDVASKMQYYYVVSYQFPPAGNLSVVPSTLKFDEVRISDAAPDTRADASELTLRPAVDSVYGILKWKVAVSNARGSVASIAGEGAPAPELKVPLPAGNLQSLASGGDLLVRMQLEDNNGQRVVMNAPPVKVKVIKTRVGLSVAQPALKLEEVRVLNAAPVIRADAPELTLRPAVDSPYGISNWKVTVSNAKGDVASLAGEGAPAAELKVPLQAADLQAIAAGGDLLVRMQLQDSNGGSLAVDAPPVKVEVIKTTANLFIVPASLTVEEVRTIDASPMLSHVYFAEGSSIIPDQYVRIAGPAETKGFDEQKYRDALAKYYQVLNIVGKRLTDNPGATVTLVGCNDNTGEEKGNKKLSARRAEAVRDYLQMAWNIAPGRLSVEARNLPEMPSAIRLKEGQAENRRVEVRSAEPAITAPIQSTYFSNRIDTTALTLYPEVDSPYGIASWKVTASNAAGNHTDLAGEGPFAGEIKVSLDGWDLGKLASGGDIAVKMELLDVKGQRMLLSPGPVKVNFIQTSQLLAQKEGLRVQEKYALILFDFDKETIDAQNQDIINRIVARAKTLPKATVEIVGHSDNTGKEDYNIKLSERRAQAVYNQLKAAYGEDAGDRIRYTGVGPNSPLYDNTLPEARSFNRTVTITLEYLSSS